MGDCVEMTDQQQRKNKIILCFLTDYKNDILAVAQFPKQEQHAELDYPSLLGKYKICNTFLL